MNQAQRLFLCTNMSLIGMLVASFFREQLPWSQNVIVISDMEVQMEVQMEVVQELIKEICEGAVDEHEKNILEVL